MHVYCSTFLFTLLVFFSISGIFLNHRWYDQTRNKENFSEQPISIDQIEKWRLRSDEEWNPDTTLISEFLAKNYSFGPPNSIELDADSGEIIFEYKVPAGYAVVIIDTQIELLSLEIQEGSTIGVLNDLHKGRNSGLVWSWVIDISAGLMCLFAITGVIILFQGKKYKMPGLISVAAGILTPLILYLVFVPKVGL